MALRLIEMVLPEKDGAEVQKLLGEHDVLEHRQIRLSDGEVLLRILVEAERSEAVLDVLEERFAGKQGNRVVVLPVEATLPRAEPQPEPEPDTATAPGQPSPTRKNRQDGSAGRSCTRTSRTPPSVRGSIWRWSCCPPSLRPSVCITTAWPSSSGPW